MTRFANNVPPVKPFFSSITKDGMYQDRVTRVQGVLYSVNIITWKSNTQAIVKGGWNNGPLGGIMARYIVKQNNGRWTVVSEQGLVEY